MRVSVELLSTIKQTLRLKLKKKVGFSKVCDIPATTRSVQPVPRTPFGVGGENGARFAKAPQPRNDTDRLHGFELDTRSIAQEAHFRFPRVFPGC